MAWPIGIELVKLSMTVRDDESGTIQHFIDFWIEKAVHKDGTVGLPYGPLGYVKKVKKYIVTDKDERLSKNGKCTQRLAVTFHSKRERRLHRIPRHFYPILTRTKIMRN